MRVRLELLRVGHCRHCERIAHRGGRWRSVEFPAFCALILHPREGAILYDTGYAPRFLDATTPWPERLYRWATPPHLDADERLEAQLAARGLRPSDIRWCLISHFHADHIAGLRDLPAARFVCMREDHAALRAASRLRAVRNGWLQALLPDDFEARLRFADDLRRVAPPPAWRALGDDGHDLFGDGSLVAVPLPGHAPRQMGLRLTDQHDREVLLCADACWSRRAWRDRALPAWPARLAMHDWPTYVATIDRLRALAKATPELAIVPSHCTESVAAYRAAAEAT
ncbi:MBL fold metallo-hydrolase [Luteimonas huabeiensis]|uniref:MBL fold metallo-hydrolase n=1 Tax=Luteimonas huabeiensis TaxID=1244513 RepID=UPI0004669B6E|nr:MBL fold metallo-hydrolase [Luteimonas huabeiensis]